MDLDGTLIKTDVLLESVLLLLKKNPFFLFVLPVWLIKGRAYLKQQIAQRVKLRCDLLPTNPQFLDYLQTQQQEGRDLILISASNQEPVRQISNHFGIFIDAIGSDGSVNLKAENKLARILQLNSESTFSYAGNSSADIPIWKEAGEVLAVNCNSALPYNDFDEEDSEDSIRVFDAPASVLGSFWKAMRPHQWLKNILLFLPLMLSHQFNQLDLVLQAVTGFISFSLCASSVYFVNDMLDLESDRQHHGKSSRPFASGELPLAYGFFGAPLLLIAAFLVATLLPVEFFLMLLAYYFLTVFYSLSLKRFFFIDAITLTTLYTLRIVAGSAAIFVTTTQWLLWFSFLMFTGLALLKRYTETNKLQGQQDTLVQGRAYSAANRKMLSAVGITCSALAVVVYMFYIMAPETTVLYSSPALLWGVSPLLLYLLARIWSKAFRGELEEDPLLFAIRDLQSQILVVLCGVVIFLAI